MREILPKPIKHFDFFRANQKFSTKLLLDTQNNLSRKQNVLFYGLLSFDSGISKETDKIESFPSQLYHMDQLDRMRLL